MSGASSRGAPGGLAALLLICAACGGDGQMAGAGAGVGDGAAAAAAAAKTSGSDRASVAVAGDGIEPAAVGRPRRALLVGVSRYHPDTELDFEGRPVSPTLQGPANDLPIVRELLQRRFGFAAGDIRELRDEQATLLGVVRAFEEFLIRGVTPDTEVVFWYCGHGSRVVDRSGVEAAGDSTLVLYDSRVSGLRAPRDLDDDALHALLSACPSERITVVTDSCHSGSVTRGGLSLTPRSLPVAADPPDHSAWEFWPAAAPIRDDDDPERRPAGWLHIAACGDTQQAFELVFDPNDGGDGLVHGALSFSLCERLRQATPGTPWDAVIEDVRLRLRRQVAQRPERDGPRGRTLFGDPLADGASGFPASARGDRVVIEAGALQGLVRGAVCEVLVLATRAPLGRALVDEVREQSAVAVWQGPPAIAPAPGATLLAVVSDPFDVRRTVPVDRASFAGLDAETRRAVEAVAWLFPVPGEAGRPLHRFVDGGAGAVLLAPDGCQVWPRAGAPRDLRDLSAEAQREARFQWLWALAGRRHGGLSADVVLATGQGPLREWVLPAPGGRATALLSFGPEHEAAHTVVLDLAQATRQVLSIHPRFVGRSSAAEGRRERHRVTVERDGADIQPLRAPGLHRILVVSSRSRLDLSSFLEDGSRSRGLDGDALFDLLPDGWGIAGCEVLVREP